MKNKPKAFIFFSFQLRLFLIFVISLGIYLNSSCKKDDGINKNGTQSSTSVGTGNSSSGSNSTVRPKASFDHNINGMGVMFKSTSTDTETYFWDFGDYVTSEDISPIHMYKRSKTYTVLHVAINKAGTDTIRKQITIN